MTSIHDEWLTPLRTGVGYFLIPVQSGVNSVGSAIYDEVVDYAKLKDAMVEKQRYERLDHTV